MIFLLFYINDPVTETIILQITTPFNKPYYIVIIQFFITRTENLSANLHLDFTSQSIVRHRFPTRLKVLSYENSSVHMKGHQRFQRKAIRATERPVVSFAFHGELERGSINSAIKGRHPAKAHVWNRYWRGPDEIPFRFNNSRVHAAVTRALIKRELKCSPGFIVNTCPVPRFTPLA